MFRTTAAAFVLTLLACVNPVHAADQDLIAAKQPVAATPGMSVAAQAADVDWSMKPVTFGPPARGSLLPALYVGLAGLNAFDAYTTTRGVSLGAAESNPVLKGVATHGAAMWAVKGGVTAGSVFMAERLWRKKNKAGAVAVMLASTGMMAIVAAHNVSVIQQQGR